MGCASSVLATLRRSCNGGAADNDAVASSAQGAAASTNGATANGTTGSASTAGSTAAAEPRSTWDKGHKPTRSLLKLNTQPEFRRTLSAKKVEFIAEGAEEGEAIKAEPRQHAVADPPKSVCPFHAQQQQPQHHHRGDEVSMKKIVDGLYDRVLTHPELKEYFEGVNMGTLKCKQERMMLIVFGGKELLDSTEGCPFDLRGAHAHLRQRGLRLHHWELFVRLFEETVAVLPELPADARDRALVNFRGTRSAFVDKEVQQGEQKQQAQVVLSASHVQMAGHDGHKACLHAAAAVPQVTDL